MKLELGPRLKFCPRCGSGYLPDSTECTPCGIRLSADVDIDVLDVRIEEPPPRPKPEEPLRLMPAEKLPDKLKVCPKCFKTQAAMLTVCPDCKTRMSPDADIDITDKRGIDQNFSGGASAFSLASMFVLTTLVAIDCALATVHVALAILFAVLVTPSVVITILRVRERQSQNKLVPWHEQISIFLHSVGLTVGAIVLAGAAILFAMLIVGSIVLVIGNWLRP